MEFKEKKVKLGFMIQIAFKRSSFEHIRGHLTFVCVRLNVKDVKTMGK